MCSAPRPSEHILWGRVSGASSLVGKPSGRAGSSQRVIIIVSVLAGVLVGIIVLALYLYYYYSVSGPYAPSGTGEYIIARVPRIVVEDVEAKGYLRGLDYRANVTVLLRNLGDRGCYARVSIYCTCDGDTRWAYDYVYVPPRSYAYAYGDVDVSFWSANCGCGAKITGIDCP